MATTLVVTNDFPPRIGGIESFVAQTCDFLDGDVVVYASTSPGSAGWDRRLRYPVVRSGRSTLLPTAAVTRESVRLLTETGASRVLFGAAAPLGLMAGALRAAGAQRLVGLTHGHEVWWATVPGTRSLLRRVGDDVDALSAISDFTARRITPALSEAARARMFRLAPPVDGRLFRPGTPRPSGSPLRCISVGRFVTRKGFGTLLRAWATVLSRWRPRHARPELVLVGDGPQRARLQQLSMDLGVTGSVRLTGALSPPEVAAELRRAQVFALAVRTRRAGLEPEGLGLAALEAAASGLPVVVGDSGGAPETVLPGRTGLVVDGSDPDALAAALTWLLEHPDVAAAMGAAGRRFVINTFGASVARPVLRRALGLPG